MTARVSGLTLMVLLLAGPGNAFSHRAVDECTCEDAVADAVEQAVEEAVIEAMEDIAGQLEGCRLSGAPEEQLDCYDATTAASY